MEATRRGFLGALTAMAAIGTSGCLLQPSLTTGDIADSPVFKRITAADWLGDTHLTIDVELKPAATDPTGVGVKKLVVIGRDGSLDWKSTVAPGTTKKKATARTDESSVLVARDADDEPVDQVEIHVQGTKLV